jgi:hypothetical protein
MIQIVPFKPEHPKMLENPRNDMEYLRFPWIDHYLELLPQSGPAFSGMIGDKIVGSCGVIYLSPGVGEVWMMLDHYLDQYPLELHKTMKAAMKVVRSQYGFTRLEALLRPSSPDTWKKWMIRLGFEYESDRKEFGPLNQDFECYVKVWR